MNRLEYIAKKLAARFGLVSPRQYLRNATEEGVLLYEAEILIGKMAWQELDKVEEMSSEYWRLRQLDSEQTKLEEEREAIKKTLEKAQDGAAVPDTEFTPQLAKVRRRLENERDRLTEKLQKLQTLIQQAEAMRRRFNGSKLKLTVLKSENAPEETLQSIRNELQSVKAAYGDLAREVENIRGEIQLLEEKIKGIQSEEENLRERLGERDRRLAREVSDVSRRLLEIGSRLGIIESEKNEIFVIIGRTLRLERESESPEYREVIQKYSPIINRARALTRSIEFNRILADFR